MTTSDFKYKLWVLDKARKGINEIFRLTAKSISELCKGFKNETIITDNDECDTIYAYVCVDDTIEEHSVKAIKSFGEGLLLYITPPYMKFDANNINWDEYEYVFPLFGSDLMGIYTLYNIIEFIDQYTDVSFASLKE